MARNDYAECLSTATVQFSGCGSFCFLNYLYGGVLILKSNLLKESVAKMQIPAIWGKDTTYNQRFFEVGCREDLTMVKLYQALDHVRRSGLRDSARRGYLLEYRISVTITAIPAHLASGAVYLLVGKTGDDLTRMLFLPENGPPEIKDLRVTLNQMLNELAKRSREVYASLKAIGYIKGKIPAT